MAILALLVVSHQLSVKGQRPPPLTEQSDPGLRQTSQTASNEAARNKAQQIKSPAVPGEGVSDKYADEISDDEVIVLNTDPQQLLLQQQLEETPQLDDRGANIVVGDSFVESTETTSGVSQSAEEEQLFSPDDLRQLERTGAELAGSGDKLIPGVTTRRERDNFATQQQPEEEQEDEDDQGDPEEQIDFMPHFSGQARGYAMLYMMHPRARATAERELQILLESQLQELYLGVLIDGTFGRDFGFLSSSLQRLADNNRIVTLALYLTNGSTMRRYDTTNINAPFVRINPEDFRDRIKFDREVQETFLALARNAKRIFDFNASLDPENINIVIVMLEDNLDAQSYRFMRQLAFSVLGDDVEYVRNPCPGCFPGNDMETFGDGLELHHSKDLFRLEAGDGFTLDGQGFLFPWENGAEGLSISDLLTVQNSAFQRGLEYFGLWRAARQGLGSSDIHPDQRNYEVPTDEQAAIEITVLRDGLFEIDDYQDEEF